MQQKALLAILVEIRYFRITKGKYATCSVEHDFIIYPLKKLERIAFLENFIDIFHPAWQYF